MNKKEEVRALPAAVGIVTVNSIGASGVFNIGDVFRISPKTSNKTFSGAGSFNTSEQLYVSTYQSSTNTFDPDVQDQGNVLNF